MNVHSTDRRVPLQQSFRNRKSWADVQGFRTGVMGEIVEGIPIREANRATTWNRWKSDLMILRRILYENYLSKNVRAVLFGVPTESDKPPFHKFAIFVQSGFLIHIEPED